MVEVIVGLYLVLNAYLGFRYGLFRRFLHIGAFFLGLLLAQALSPGFAEMINYNTGTHPAAGHFFLYICVVFGLVLAAEILSFAFGSMLAAMNALLFDRFFGMVVGALAAVFEMAVVLYLFVYMYAVPLPSGATQPDIVNYFSGQVNSDPVARGLTQLRPYVITIYSPVLPPEPATYFAKTFS